MNTTARSGVSGSVTIGGTKYSISGKLDTSGTLRQTVKRGRVNMFQLFLEVDPTDADRMLGFVTPMDGSWTAYLEGDRAVFNKTTWPAPQAGRYNLTIPGRPGSTTMPQGNGYATVKVDAAGKITMTGSLPDGTTLSQSATLSKYGVWPLYASLYTGRGSLLSWITIGGPGVGSSLGGDLSWTKPPLSTAKYYPAGFTMGTGTWGSSYTPPPPGTPMLYRSQAQVVLHGGGLAQDLVNIVMIASNNRVTSLNKVTMTFTSSTGVFKGTVPNPAGGRAKPLAFSGVILPLQYGGLGYFLGTDQSGQMSYHPQ
jgi:hypothetical protein